MSNAEPPFLYKYREPNEYALRMLTHREIFLAPHNSFNDPFELKWRICMPFSPRGQEYLAERACDFQYPDASQAERSIHIKNLTKDIRTLGPEFLNGIAPIGVFCMSAVPDHILMWGHYARCHRGICVQIDRTKLGRKTQRVQYSTEIPQVRASDMFPPKLIFRNTQFSAIKADVWKYEKEWRTIAKPGLIQLPEGAVTGVIVGALCDEDFREQIRRATLPAKGEIRIYEAKLSDTEYRVIIPGINA